MFQLWVPNNKVSDEPRENQGLGWSTANRVSLPPQVISLLAVPRPHYCFASSWSWLFYVTFVALSVSDILFVMLKLFV